MESRDPRFQTLYQSHIREIEEGTSAGLVTVDHGGEKQVIEAEHVVMEIGSSADYSPFERFEPLEQIEKYDNYRFQLHQVMTHPHNYEAVSIPNLYMGGYLASGIGLVVIAMHGTTYAIAGDILQKEGLISET